MNCSPGAGRRPRLSGRHALAKVAQTALDNLGKALGESCSAATLDGDNVLYIARAAVK
ncbi:Pca regulon regulatory protein PcaR [Klebsiella pneumoniae]|uniref:Pca regulon regulatory protein PcaR n=1 Tax=Klebsiella pneumoniae TaxID=573 RepID=A0A2X3H383_KLEPN|nr:Pca regulon regulatory protein PcaR [Klebsiella pneumoniae]